MCKYDLSEFKERLVTEINEILIEKGYAYTSAIVLFPHNGKEKEFVMFKDISNDSDVSEMTFESQGGFELSTLYDTYLDGCSIQDLAIAAIERFMEGSELGHDLEDYVRHLTREEVLANVSVRLLPLDVMGREGFSYVRQWNDLSVVLDIAILSNECIKGSMCLTEQFLAWFGITVDEAYLTAYENIRKEPYILMNYPSVENGCTKGLMNMFHYSNQNIHYGAKMVLNTKPLKELAERLDSDLYLCPSSVHEWIVLPKNEMPISNLLDIHSSVQEMLGEFEKLSSSVYVYRRDLDAVGQVSLVNYEKEV